MKIQRNDRGFMRGSDLVNFIESKRGRSYNLSHYLRGVKTQRFIIELEVIYGGQQVFYETIKGSKGDTWLHPLLALDVLGNTLSHAHLDELVGFKETIYNIVNRYHEPFDERKLDELIVGVLFNRSNKWRIKDELNKLDSIIGFYCGATSRYNFDDDDLRSATYKYLRFIKNIGYAVIMAKFELVRDE